MRRTLLLALLSAAGVCCAGPSAAAGVKDFFPFCRNSPGVRTCPTPIERSKRAGWPHCVAPWARPSCEPHDQGYIVGGGAAAFGQPRRPLEGTWGWDHAPWYSRVRLGWWHGRKFQDGEGQYEADRPNNPFRHAWGFGR